MPLRIKMKLMNGKKNSLVPISSSSKSTIIVTLALILISFVKLGYSGQRKDDILLERLSLEKIGIVAKTNLKISTKSIGPKVSSSSARLITKEIAVPKKVMVAAYWSKSENTTDLPVIGIKVKKFNKWTTASDLDVDPLEGPDQNTREYKVESARQFTEPLWLKNTPNIKLDISIPSNLSLKDFHLVLLSPKQENKGSKIWLNKLLSRLFEVKQASAGSTPNIITRSQWGADESIRKDDPDYAPALLKAIVHHTAGSNDYTKADSPAIVRSIYKYHTLVRGWNDIGYNFLIDKYGQIFEGRYGGAARNVIGAHAEGFNSGTVGVSFIGNYQSISPSTDTKNAAVKLLAWRLARGLVDPTGKSTINGKYIDNIIGHRNVGSTSCPGNKSYDYLPDLRAKVNTLVGQMGYVKKKIVYRNDIATFFNYGNGETRIHGFASNGSNFDYSESNGWWKSSGYYLNKVKKIASGDFNGDGKGDLAALYDYGNGETRFHVFLSDGNKLKYQGPSGWWKSSGYYLNKVKKIASGDFNGDGKDDIVIMCDYGKGETRIQGFASNGSSFDYSGSNGWWKSYGYYLNKVKKIASGDFNGDSKGDLAALYDYGNGETRFHVFLSDGNKLKYQGPNGWWKSYGYYLNKVKKIASGDFNSDGLTDIATIYSYDTRKTRIHMFLSAMDANYDSAKKFDYEGPNGWWSGLRYDSNGIKQSLVGDFNMDGADDIANMYDYGAAETRIHVFLSGMKKLNYQGNNGWWNAKGYDLQRVPQAESSFFIMSGDGDRTVLEKK